MDNIVFYFSGTGNSLQAAKTLSRALDNADMVSMAKPGNYCLSKPYATVGFVYPVYYFGLPKKVIAFVRNLSLNPGGAYYYSVATYGGFVGNGVRQMKELLREKNIALNYGAKVKMVANYIIMYNLFNNVERCLRRADKKLSLIIKNIKNKKNNRVKKPVAFIQRRYEKVMSTACIAAGFNRSDRCGGCGICSEVCPAKNITMINKKPTFGSACECCVACIQFCPWQAINYKDKTQKRKRYTHPKISYRELSVGNR